MFPGECQTYSINDLVCFYYYFTRHIKNVVDSFADLWSTYSLLRRFMVSSFITNLQKKTERGSQKYTILEGVWVPLGGGSQVPTP